jgi:medium-chain acyl-[acyl-carrier-protein] hydrolase
VFKSWSSGLPEEVEVWPIQLPGRERRMGEAPIADLPTLVTAIAEGCIPYLDRDFALFGHSFGTLLSFEVARTLRRISPELDRRFIHFFASGFPAPQHDQAVEPLSTLSDVALTDYLRKLGGTPEEVLQSAGMMRALLPVFRIDCHIRESYRYQPGAPFSCPVTAIGGTDDFHAASSDLEGWQQQTTGSFACRTVPGDHFFLRKSEAEILRFIAERLSCR